MQILLLPNPSSINEQPPSKCKEGSSSDLITPWHLRELAFIAALSDAFKSASRQWFGTNCTASLAFYILKAFSILNCRQPRGKKQRNWKRKLWHKRDAKGRGDKQMLLYGVVKSPWTFLRLICLYKWSRPIKITRLPKFTWPNSLQLRNRRIGSNAHNIPRLWCFYQLNEGSILFCRTMLILLILKLTWSHASQLLLFFRTHT